MTDSLANLQKTDIQVMNEFLDLIIDSLVELGMSHCLRRFKKLKDHISTSRMSPDSSRELRLLPVMGHEHDIYNIHAVRSTEDLHFGRSSSEKRVRKTSFDTLKHTPRQSPVNHSEARSKHSCDSQFNRSVDEDTNPLPVTQAALNSNKCIIIPLNKIGPSPRTLRTQKKTARRLKLLSEASMDE